jgi:hypothetical protein
MTLAVNGGRDHTPRAPCEEAVELLLRPALTEEVGTENSHAKAGFTQTFVDFFS